MFDLSWGEIAVIGAVALIVIGPKELPGVIRGVGQSIAKMRRMAADFQYQFNEALREAEVDKVKSTIADVTSTVNAATPAFNPIDYAREQIKSAVDDVKSATALPQPGDLIGPVKSEAGDPLAQAIPTPSTYSADASSIQAAIAAAPTPPPFATAPPPPSGAPMLVSVPDRIAEPVAMPAPAMAPVVPEPSAVVAAEPVDEKPVRSRKTTA